MSGPTDVVIAGTKPFALALFAPVTERAGSRPRIAPEPALALTLCAQSSGLLVVEYEPRWLPALTQLRLDRPALRMVAALSRGQEGAALSLGPLSIEVVPWDGQAASVMAAIERALVVGPAEPTATVGHAPIEPAPMSVAISATSLAQSSPALSRSNPKLAQVSPALSRSNPTLAPSSPLPPLPSPVHAGVAWPATGPSAAEAELALRALLAGKVDTSPLRTVTEQTVAGLSSLERDVFSGGNVPVDDDLIRHAAVLRLRTAAALATRPPAGTRVDSEAVAELLSEIDGVLHRVKALVDVATAEFKPSLEAIRNALVREAVDFSEACHDIGTAELPLVKAPEKLRGRAAPRSVLEVRLLSAKSGGDDHDVTERKRGRVIWFLLALALIGGGAVHGYRWWKTEQVVGQWKTLPGQPERMMLLPAPPGATTRELVPMGGAPDRAEVERFKAQQHLTGNIVTETSQGGLLIQSAPPTGEKGTKP